MTTADLALLVSIISAFISLGVLAWNIYRDVILKPEVKVALQVSVVVEEGDDPEDRERKVNFIATNYGPGPVTLEGIKSKTRRFLRKTKWAFLLHDYHDPLSNSFPCKLNVGDKAMFMIPFREGIFLKGYFKKIGIWDSFGRTHWVSKRDIETARETYNNEFGTASEGG
jgi:hypothetical protein